MMDSMNSTASGGSARIDLLNNRDVAYWCRVFDLEPSQLRRAIQCVGPRCDAVMRHLQRAPAVTTPAQRTNDWP